MPRQSTYGFYSKNTKVGDVFGDFIVVENPKGGKTKVRCKCGEIRIHQTSELHQGRRKSCGCERGYEIGEIVNGRRVVRLSSHDDPCLTVECLKCGYQAKIRAGYQEAAVCRNCEGFDAKLIANGIVYALVCPFTGEMRYVGGTRYYDLKIRLRDHFKARLHPKKKDRALYEWIRELEAFNERPKIVPLEKVITGDLHEREAFWVKRLIAEGCKLFNIDYNLNNNPRKGEQQPWGP
jgi:hypothetical protein